MQTLIATLGVSPNQTQRKKEENNPTYYIDPLDGFVVSPVHDYSMNPYHDTLTTDNSIGTCPCCDIHGNLAAQPANLPRECPSTLGSYSSQYINPSDIMAWQPLLTEQTPAINFTFSTSQGRDMPIVQVTVEPDSTIVANFFDTTSDWTQPPLPPDTQWEPTENMTTGINDSTEETQVLDGGLHTRNAGQYSSLLMIEGDDNYTRNIKNEAERIKRIMRELEEMENRQRIHAQNQLKTIGDGL